VSTFNPFTSSSLLVVVPFGKDNQVRPSKEYWETYEFRVGVPIVSGEYQDRVPELELLGKKARDKGAEG
jgi:hypothetical protein